MAALERPLTHLPQIHVDVGRCAGCQECVVRCPAGALTLDPETWMATGHDEMCVGCRQCERTCPFGAIVVEGIALASPRTAVPHRAPAHLAGSVAETRPGFENLDEARAAALRCLQCPDPTCVLGCPAHNDIPGFIAAVIDGDLERARTVLSETSVMPEVCSRVCDQSVQCEGACSWTLAGAEPVQIGLIERFVADRTYLTPPVPAPQDGADLSVAVVGGGPAGLAAAWELKAAGADVHLFERDREPLGVLAWGIPDFTLPTAVARRPLDALLEAGVSLSTGVEVGRDEPLSDLLDRFDAVILAYGAGAPIAVRVEGADLPWVEDAARFLGRAKAALLAGKGLKDIGPGRTVLVIGAGNTAMDVARSARRLGAQAVAIDWMDRRFARVRPDELDEAGAEGVEVRFLTSAAAFREEEGRRVAYLSATTQPDPRRRPRLIGTPVPLPVDLVVMAMGYRVEPEAAAQAGVRLPLPPADPTHTVAARRLMASGLLAARTPVGALVRQREAQLQASGHHLAPRVWVAGDALTGPATVVAAIAQGKAAARSLLAERPRRPAVALPPSPSASSLVPQSVLGSHAALRQARRPAAAVGLRLDPLPFGAVAVLLLGVALRLALGSAPATWLALAPGVLALGFAAFQAYVRRGVDRMVNASGAPRAAEGEPAYREEVASGNGISQRVR